MKEKPKSPAETIEKDAKSNQEVVYIHYPGVLEDVSLNGKQREVEANIDRIRNLMQEHGENKSYLVHTHLHGNDLKEKGITSFPTPHDFEYFLLDDEVEIMAIAQVNPDYDGKFEGYYVFRKTKDSVKTGVGFSKLLEGRDEKERRKIVKMIGTRWRMRIIEKQIWDYYKNCFGLSFRGKLPDERQKALNELVEKMHLQVRYVPAKGYKYSLGDYFEKENPKEIRRLHGNLEKQISALIVGIMGIFLMGYSYSSSVVGSSVLDLNEEASYFIVSLILLSVLGLLVWKKRGR